MEGTNKIISYHIIVNGLFNCCLAFYWHLPPGMLYWWHCWVGLDVILSLERAKSVKTVRIEFKEVLYTADLDSARFVKDRVLLGPGKLLGVGALIMFCGSWWHWRWLSELI